MKVEHRFEVTAPVDHVWPLFLDLPAVAACVPGVSDVEPADGTRYRGRLRVGVGPIRLALEGEVSLEVLDAAAGQARLTGTGSDRRLGGAVKAVVDLSVSPRPGGGTVVVVASDVQVLGRIGELGQPIMRRKADEVMRAFSACLEARLG